MFIAKPEDTVETQRVYDGSAKARGFVMNLTRAWAWRPEIFDGLNALGGQLMRGSTLGKREQAVLVCSMAAELGDSYCALAWGKALASEAGPGLAAAVIEDVPCETLTARERALAAWTRLVVHDPNSTTESEVQTLREAGLTEREIFEATVFVALRLAFSTVNDALGIAPDRELADQVPARVRAAVAFGRKPHDRLE